MAKTEKGHGNKINVGITETNPS